MYLIVFMTVQLKMLSRGQVTLNINIGGSAYQTGVRNFTVRPETSVDSTGKSALRVTCVSLLPFDTNLSLVGTSNSDTFSNSPSQNKISKKFVQSKAAGVFSCQQRFVRHIKSDVPAPTDYRQLNFYLESEVKIQVSSKKIMASSVGVKGYRGEKAVLICLRGLQSKPWKELSVSHHEVTLPFNTTELTCGVDNLPPIETVEKLVLTISPSNFTDAELTDLTLNCTSSPPRLTYWSVVGSNGNIMDFGGQQETLASNLDVTVRQRAGESTLRLSETLEGANGIHTISCTSYDTRAHVVATAHRLETVSSKTEESMFVVSVLITSTAIMSTVTSILLIYIVKLKSKFSHFKTVNCLHMMEMRENPIYVPFRSKPEGAYH